MSKEVRVIRSDDLLALLAEYDHGSWEEVGESVLQTLADTIGEQELAAMSWQQLIRLGYRNGAGHLLMAILADELHVELIPNCKTLKNLKSLVEQVTGDVPEE
jgi:hypothetical protein